MEGKVIRLMRPQRILAIGSHPDDVELGCGGALARHVARGDEVTICVVTAGTAGPGDGSVRIEEQRRSCSILGANLEMGDFEDTKVSLQEHELVLFLESVVTKCNPDLVYTHSVDDTHQDHRAVAIASLGATRKRPRVLAYEAPSSLGFLPNAFVDISDTLDKKLAALACHHSQVTGSTTLDVDAIRGQAMYRGFQARTLAAEGFITVRYLLDV
jgi:LmbE family N-acetylglucosaminyl deacetylase